MSLDQLKAYIKEKEEERKQEEAIRQHWQDMKKKADAEHAQKTAWAKPIETMNPADYRRWRESGLELHAWLKKEKN